MVELRPEELREEVSVYWLIHHDNRSIKEIENPHRIRDYYRQHIGHLAGRIRIGPGFDPKTREIRPELWGLYVPVLGDKVHRLGCTYGTPMTLEEAQHSNVTPHWMPALDELCELHPPKQELVQQTRTQHVGVEVYAA